MYSLDQPLWRIQSGVRVRWREDTGFAILAQQPDGSALEMARMDDSADALSAYKLFVEMIRARRGAGVTRARAIKLMA